MQSKQSTRPIAFAHLGCMSVYANYPADSADVHLLDAHTVTVNGVRVRLLPHVVF